MSTNIFCCYAHEDEALFKKLKSHIRLLQRQKLVHIWHDRDISSGTEWERAISRYLDEAQIILLLISPDFLDSEYCYSVEMQRAMERYASGEIAVIPILLRPTDRKGTPFEKLPTLPSEGKPVTSWRNRDEAFLNIAVGIRKAIEKLHSLERNEATSDRKKHATSTQMLLENESASVSSSVNPQTKVLNIPLLPENLEVDSHQLKKNLQGLYGSNEAKVKVNIDMYDLDVKLIEIVEKICRGIEANEIPTAADVRPFLLRQIKNCSEHWPICFPLYNANLSILLSNLVEEVFISYKNPLEALTIARESLENTLEYVHYRLVIYLKRAVWADLTRQFGFPAIAAYLKKYEAYDFASESTKRALMQIYKDQSIHVNSLEQIYLVASKSKSAGSWRVYFPNLTEDDRMEIMVNCQTYHVILGYSWHVFFLPQVIGNALMDISFGEGKKVDELPYKVGLNLKDYECVGFP